MERLKDQLSRIPIRVDYNYSHLSPKGKEALNDISGKKVILEEGVLIINGQIVEDVLMPREPSTLIEYVIKKEIL